MPKVKPERIAGIVALSYLVLIPAGAFLAYMKLQAMDEDVSTMWEHLEMNPSEGRSVISINKLKGILKR